MNSAQASLKVAAASLKAVARAAVARVAEVVKEAGPHRHHLEMDALIGRIVPFGDQASIRCVSC